MGQAIASLRETISAGDKAAKKDVLEQLAFLVNAANSKLDKYQGDLDEMFTDKESVQKKMVPGYRALRWERGYRVGVDKSASGGPLGEVVNAFFGSGEKEKDDNSPVLSGFKVNINIKLIQGSLDAILGNANAGEQEEEKFFVFVHHNAIIRIDTKIWRYNFNGKGVMAESENVFCYIFCTSVVDHNALQIDELTYLLSEHAGDEEVEAYVDKLISVWTKIRSIAALTGNFQQKLALYGPPTPPEESRAVAVVS
ncbi:hypothetical protein M422DRAFT_176891 [Sphaerobolus stellatus SS14]|uniref:Uncharacterized protein n=1 Tax=Sphaerobolus stellatus (strain SS14) TaxID=990650 RepID=A0A0C9UPJ7_SPHS4|nr:hypothetical protein M422DRAFT_186622 [Sphaerobolus stellatus SS14]KIJ38211.1 hypothetical protein M422DRAFT_176891 [Sphaerobolus stellatus SS14]